MNNRIFKAQRIVITYDRTLQLITDRESEECVVSQNTYFFFILASVLETYPEIKKRFPPGILGFTVNGVPPDDDTLLQDGDIVHFSIPTIGNYLIEGQ
ncbi:MAG: hypothetical protein B5M53_10530 [Candidatus Cloacimonas sp. 4484_209]|nr:MAG: hypothetical protein B5M53_10530 [Candidatus Cloacimonas sp. 4484_209]